MAAACTPSGTDDFNREIPHIEMDTSITTQRLVRIFEQVRPLPRALHVDNGPKFLGAVFVSWGKHHGTAIRYIQPGKPNQNAYMDCFNRTYREKVLDQYLFARRKTSARLSDTS